MCRRFRWCTSEKNIHGCSLAHSIRLKSDSLIDIDHVTFGYDTSRTILKDVNLRFARGKVTSILGGSGCG